MDKRIELLLIILGTIMALVSCGVIHNEEKDMLAETTTVKEETKEIETTQSDDKKEYLSGIVPEELEYIPEEYKQPAEHPGTLEKLTYTTWESFTYEEHSQELTKEAWVYLPYGYSEEEKYNVFYLSHGGWSNETTLMGTDRSASLEIRHGSCDRRR